MISSPPLPLALISFSLNVNGICVPGSSSVSNFGGGGTLIIEYAGGDGVFIVVIIISVLVHYKRNVTQFPLYKKPKGKHYRL